MGFAHDNVVLAIVFEFLTHAKVYVVTNCDIFAIWANCNNDTSFTFVAGREDKQFVFLNIWLNDGAVLVGSEGHFLLFGAGFWASRLTEYAMATACLTGLPDATSAFTFARNAFLLGDLTSGITSPFWLVWPFWQTL
jgi:hypothetical protein